MDDLTSRLARLTPAQRAILDHKLGERTAGTGRIPRLGGTRAPLTLDQERIWLLHRFDPTDPAYNVFFGSRLCGELDTAVLARAVNAVVNRHEALRTTFEWDGTRPEMVVHQRMPVTPVLVDLTGFVGDDRDRRADEEIRDAIRRPFDLRCGPLLRITLLRLAHDEHLLVGAVHHLVWDRASSGIFAAELAEHYRAFVLGERPAVPRLTIQYADYARWQPTWLEREVRPRHVPYWRQRLADAPLALDLPTDRPRPPVRTFHGARHRFRFDQELTVAVRDFARRCGVTTNVVLLAGWTLLLQRLSGQSDIVTGTTSSTRSRPETEPLIGYFLTMLPLRTTVRPDMTVRELVHAVRDTVAGALDHHDTPFGMLLDELAVPRDPGRNPIYQTGFTYVDFHHEQAVALPGLTQEVLLLDNSTTKDEITLGVFDDLASGETFLGVLEYSTDLFTEDTMRRIAGRLTALLRRAIGAPDTPVADISPLTDDERAAVVFRWNATSVPPEHGRLDELVRTRAAAAPDAVAVRAADERLSYGELVHRAERLAGHLRTCGVKDGDLVGICLERSAGMVVALLGVLMAGAAYLPLDPSYPKARLALMAEDARPAALLAEQATVDALPSGAGRVVLVDRDAAEIVAASPPAGPSAPGAGAVAYVIYTSGSTGRPKGVAVSHGSVVNLLASAAIEVGLTPADRWAAIAPISFDIAGLELFGPLVTGATIVLLAREVAGDGRRLAAALAEYDATIMQATPPTWQLLFEAGWRDGGRMRAICGGEALSPALAADLARGQRRAWNAYGPTETTIYSTCDRIGRDGVAIGEPIANTRVYVLDERLMPAPVGVAGELYVGGAGVALGYRARPGETASRFVADHMSGRHGQRLYRTGDVAHWRPDGRLVFERRNDSQVKLRGHRIEPGEVQARLAEHPLVREAVVLVREDRPGDRRLVAYVRHDGTTPRGSALRAWLRAALPDHLMPNNIVPLAAFPLTPSGKVDRAALPAPADAPRQADRVAPRDALELAVARLWARVLGVPQVGVTDSFFDLGGHSLLVLGLMVEVEREFGVSLPIAAIFQGATVARFAELLRDHTGDDREARVVLLRPGTGTPVFVMHIPGNGLMCYLPLMEHLRPADRPVYGVSSPAVAEGALPYRHFAERAAAYADVVRQVQPGGPYTLLGYSYGGISAHAVACELERQGERASAVLIDSHAPQSLTSGPGMARETVVAAIAEQLHTGPPDELAPRSEVAAMSEDDRLRYLLRVAEASGHLPAGTGHGHIAALLDQWTADLRLLVGYRPAPLAGPLVLLRAAEEDPASKRPWYDVATEGLRVEVVPGNHITAMREPLVGTLAATLNTVLDAG